MSCLVNPSEAGKWKAESYLLQLFHCMKGNHFAYLWVPKGLLSGSELIISNPILELVKEKRNL